MYLGSADWMPRNLYERVEVIFPVKDELLRERVRQEILESYLADNLKPRVSSEGRELCSCLAGAGQAKTAKRSGCLWRTGFPDRPGRGKTRAGGNSDRT